LYPSLLVRRFFIRLTVDVLTELLQRLRAIISTVTLQQLDAAEMISIPMMEEVT